MAEKTPARTFAHEIQARVTMRNEHAEGVVVDRVKPETGQPQYHVEFADDLGRPARAWWEEDMLEAA